MVAREFQVLGLMSGTSCDGLSMAAARISGRPSQPRVRCLAHAERRYPAALRERLLRAAGERGGTASEIAALHAELGEFWGTAAARFASRAGGLERFDLVASHGHTLHHHPPRAGSRGWTLQIGDPATLSERTGLPVAYDFRSRDMALGGQGAPLVPRADEVFFAAPREPRVALNLGGIANITVLPASRDASRLLAFDTGPGNMVMDALAALSSRGRAAFDRGGKLAASGRPDATLLQIWLGHPFFLKPPPRSTGREDFGAAFLRPAMRAVRARRLRWSDALATATLLTSVTVAASVHAYAMPGTRLVVGAGGGMSNPLLRRTLARWLAPLRLVPSDRFGIPSGAREALAFALLGYFTWHRIPGNVPNATGARQEAVLGSLTVGSRRKSR